jgi:1-acyl-sn-glycerol-3-phosphate acyltransferase
MPLEPLNKPESRWQGLLGSLRAIPLVGFLFSSLIGFNLAQTLSVGLLPFSRRAFRRFNRWCANTWWGWCVIGGEKLLRTKVIITGDDVPEAENAIVLANHQQMPDITTIMAFARAKKRLGDLKWFVKRALRPVPGLGWGMQFLNCLFVNRDWAKDREMIVKTFSTIVTERIPLWLISFAEGTRVTPEKLARNHEYAVRSGQQPTEHVLLPRTRGFVASVQGMGEHISAVYDLTIGYVEGVPTLWQYICGRVRHVHLHVRRFPIEELPRLENELAEWLTARYQEKDRLLAWYYEGGAFPSEPLPPELAN